MMSRLPRSELDTRHDIVIKTFITNLGCYIVRHLEVDIKQLFFNTALSNPN